MLSIGAMKSAQSRYYQELAREDYYLKGGEPPGTWLGDGASALGCSGAVTAEELSCFFQGYAVDGTPLVQNAGKPNRQCGWDLTFSVPKSVSVLWSQLEANEQNHVRESQAEAVKAAIEYLEKNFAVSRIGRGGAEEVQAKLVVAAFEHSTSRALDPQLHTHCLVLNLGVDEKGCVRSILSKPFYEAKMLAGAFYRCELSRQLQERLGVNISRPLQMNRKPASWFEVEGIPQSILSYFSKRRLAIENELGARGLESASAAAFAALSTREAKIIVPPRKELHARWKKEGVTLGFSKQILDSLVGASTARINEAGERKRVCREILTSAADEITHGENAFTLFDITRRALEAAQEHGFPATIIAESVERELNENPSFVSLGIRNGKERWTTQDVLAEERQFLSTVQKLSERPFRPIAEAHVAATIARIRGAKGNYYQLDDEQQAAVRYITQGIGAIKVVSGFAGAGKTDMLSAAKEALEKEGYRVIGTALAGVAARNLEESSGIKSETVRMRELQLLGPSLGKTIKHHAVQLGRAAIGKNTASLPRLDIDRRTVLVIDEAGMLGTRDFAMLAKAVVQGGGTIIAIGDDKQLPSIERGGGFKYLVETLGGVKLSEIRRQRDVGDRAAVKNVVAGNPEESLWHYAAKGQFFVAGQQEAVEAQLLADWTRNGGAECPSDHRIFASTRTEVARLNTLAQQERLQAGFLDAREAIRHEGVTFIVGDRVRFNAAMKACGIQKGETGTVVACKDSFTGKYLAVARSEGGPLWSEYALQVVKHHALQLVNAAIGKQTTLPPPRQDILLVPLETSIPFSKVYRGLSLDYAMTTHLGQGQTVENAYVLLGGKMTDRELSYVQMSRHRNVLQLYAGEQHAGKELAEMARRHYKGQEFASIESELPDYSTLVARIRQSHIKDLASSPSYNAEFYHAAANEQY